MGSKEGGRKRKSGGRMGLVPFMGGEGWERVLHLERPLIAGRSARMERNLQGIREEHGQHLPYPFGP